MQERYKTKLVLFDLDGTLIDTAPDFLLSLNNFLKNHGRDEITIEQIRPHISEGSSKLIKFFLTLIMKMRILNSLRMNSCLNMHLI